MGTQKNRLSEKILFSTHITFIIDEKFLFSAQKLILKRRCVVHPVGSENPLTDVQCTYMTSASQTDNLLLDIGVL